MNYNIIRREERTSRGTFPFCFCFRFWDELLAAPADIAINQGDFARFPDKVALSASDALPRQREQRESENKMKISDGLSRTGNWEENVSQPANVLGRGASV